MKLLKKCIAINTLLLLALLCFGAAAQAASTVGSVVDLSGLLVAKRINGTMKVLTQKSDVEQGDILFSEKNTYARVRFIDNSEITLQPNSQLEVANFSYDAAKPKGDSAVFNLIKGGLRSISGLLGKRSSENVTFTTPAATI